MPYTLTTPLYYVNDRPHLGSTYTTLACDALARFQRLSNGSVVFITGVDEHGQKIQRTAEARQLSPQQHCDAISARSRDLWSRWGILRTDSCAPRIPAICSWWINSSRGSRPPVM